LLTKSQNWDILDIGAFNGDSLTTLENWTNGRIASFELIPEIWSLAKWVSESLNKTRHIVLNEGVSDFPRNITIVFGAQHGGATIQTRSIVLDLLSIDVLVIAIDQEQVLIIYKVRLESPKQLNIWRLDFCILPWFTVRF